METQADSVPDYTARDKKARSRFQKCMLEAIEELELLSSSNPEAAREALHGAFCTLTRAYEAIQIKGETLSISAHLTELLLLLYFKFGGDWSAMHRCVREELKP